MDNEQDFDFSDVNFNDILNDLRELSEEAENTSAQEQTAKKSPTKNQPTNKAKEYHTISLFSDVPITALPPKTELTSKQKSDSSQRTVTVKKDETTKEQQMNKSSAKVEATIVARTDRPAAEVTRKQSPPVLRAAMPVTKASTKSVTIATNEILLLNNSHHLY